MIGFAFSLEMVGNGLPTQPAEVKNLLKDQPDAKAFFDTFHGEKDVTIVDLHDYLDYRLENTEMKDGKKTRGPFEEEIFNALKTMEDPNADSKSRVEAEQKIQKLLQYLKDRNQKMDESRSSLVNMDFERQVSSTRMIDTVWDKTKSALSATTEGFMNADGKDKIVMAAGVLAAFFMARALWTKLGGGNSTVGKFAKGTVGLGLGLGVSWMALEAVNKAVEKTTGKPFMLKKGEDYMPRVFVPGMGQTIDEWHASRYQYELQKTYEQMKASNMPPEFVNQLLGDVGGKSQDLRFTKGIVNLSTLSIPEFHNLYLSSKNAAAIPDNGLFPTRPLPDDSKVPGSFLSPIERFAMVKQMGIALGLIDPATGNCTLPAQPERQNKDLYYLILDWQGADKK